MTAVLPYVPAPGEAPPLEAIFAAYPWVRALQETPQDAIFHAEGDVWTHTGMVLTALSGSPAWQQLPDIDRKVLFWSALLHDVAKPHTTVSDEAGRIRSPRHALRGERLARALLWQGVPEPVPFDLRERIAKLVRYHGLPLWFLDRSDPNRSLISASQFVPLAHIALLAEADVRGRICDDSDELLAAVDLFRSLASELSCLEAPYPFPSPLGRFTYLSGRSDSREYRPYDASWGSVLMLSGLPGAGKDSWIAANRPELPVVSLDALRAKLGIRHSDPQGTVLQAAREQARSYLRKRQPFVWNATNLIRVRRKALVDLFIDYGARVAIHYLEPAFERLLEQNRSRPNSIPEGVLRRYLDRFDLPDISEAHEVVVHHP